MLGFADQATPRVAQVVPACGDLARTDDDEQDHGQDQEVPRRKETLEHDARVRHRGLGALLLTVRVHIPAGPSPTTTARATDEKPQGYWIRIWGSVGCTTSRPASPNDQIS